MKKIITVLLLVAIMFTFSFGNAFAAVGTYNNALAAANFDVAMELVKDADKIKLGTYTVDYAIFKDYKTQILELALYEAKKGTNASVTGYVNTVAELQAILADATNDGLDLATEIVAKQYEADKTEGLAVLDGLDLSEYATADMPQKDADGCKTYREHVKHLIDEAVKAINEAGEYLDADSPIADYKTAIDIFAAYIYTYDNTSDLANELVVEKGYTAGSDKVGLGIYEINDQYDLDGDGAGTAKLETYKTVYIEAQAASDAAGIATVKAAIAQAYASYIRTKTDAADKAYANDMKKILDFLAEQEVALGNVSGNNYFLTDYRGNEVKKASKVAAAVSAAETFEVKAARLAAQKDANGKLVRDAAEVADLVAEGIILEYAAAVGLSYSSKDPALTNSAACLAAIAGLYTGLGDAELEFAKATKITMISGAMQIMEIDESACIADREFLKALFKKFNNKINAITHKDDFGLALLNALNGIVDALDDWVYILERPATKELQSAARQYIDFLNEQITKDSDKHYVGADINQPDYKKIDKMVADLVGESGAKTAKEIEALKDRALELVNTVPTYAEVQAAYESVEDALDAIPRTVRLENRDIVDVAVEAGRVYGNMIGASKYEIIDTRIKDAIGKLVYAYKNEIISEIKTADASDRAVFEAMLDKIDVLIADYPEYFGRDALLDSSASLFRETIDEIKKHLDVIKAADSQKVINAIAAIPLITNLTEADRPVVEAARAAYDTYVETWTDVDDWLYFPTDDHSANTDGFVADDFDYIKLFDAESLLGFTALQKDTFDDTSVKAYLQDLSVIARSVKTEDGNIKVTAVADVDILIKNGYTVEYRFYRSTKSNKNFGKYKKASEDATYTNTAGKTGTKYYYKVVIVIRNAEGEVVASTPLKHCSYATRTWNK